MSTSDTLSNNGQEAATAEASVPTIKTGNFCWWELATTDPDAAKSFYGSLFGWSFNDIPMGPEMTYTMFHVDGNNIAACYKQDAEQASKGIPPNWMSYVLVDNADATAAKVAPAGGMLAMEPMDVMDAGRMGVVVDPTGAVFGIWQAGKHVGATHTSGVGSVCWNELVTKDPAVAGPFYSAVFGWAPDEQNMPGDENKPDGMKYTMFKNGDSTAGGMMQITPEMGPHVPSHWMPYFTVADCDGSVAKAQEMNATVIVPPMDIPQVGRFSLMRDPQGAYFSFIKLEGM